MGMDTRIVTDELLTLNCTWCKEERVLGFVGETDLEEFLTEEAGDWCCSSECRTALVHAHTLKAKPYRFETVGDEHLCLYKMSEGPWAYRLEINGPGTRGEMFFDTIEEALESYRSLSKGLPMEPEPESWIYA